MSSSATVELLTAEVRVLFVGSRQVTLSVARQLDRISLSRLEVFGRVKLGTDTFDRATVIGRDTTTGVLALAEYSRHPNWPTWIDEETLGTGKVIVCDSYAPSTYRLTFDGKVLEVPSSCVQKCGLHRLHGKCDGWSPNGFEAAITQTIVDEDLSRARHKAACDAPLIVLAGLK